MCVVNTLKSGLLVISIEILKTDNLCCERIGPVFIKEGDKHNCKYTLYVSHQLQIMFPGETKSYH